nr:MAG TPA: hypothetical protein [Caudoviricetes sp.]
MTLRVRGPGFLTSDRNCDARLSRSPAPPLAPSRMTVIYWSHQGGRKRPPRMQKGTRS